MNKNIRLLVEGFFDDDIFDVEDNIKTDIEDLGKYYYDYQIGEIFYQNKKPYAVCCGDRSYFKDNKLRFCLLEDTKKDLRWRTERKLVKKLSYFEFEDFDLKSFNDFKHIDEDGYKNTQIIKNYYNISEFPAFEYCINLGDNVYLPSINEIQIMYLNKNKLGKYSLRRDNYWSSTQYSNSGAWSISTIYSYVASYYKNYFRFRVRPFFNLG